MFNLNRSLIRNNALMQYKFHNYNFIIFLAQHFCPKKFIFTLDLLIKYLMNIKDK
jgi:hypothetical protein